MVFQWMFLLIGLLLTACSPSVVVERPTACRCTRNKVGLVGPALSEQYIIQPGDSIRSEVLLQSGDERRYVGTS